MTKISETEKSIRSVLVGIFNQVSIAQYEEIVKHLTAKFEGHEPVNNTNQILGFPVKSIFDGIWREMQNAEEMGGPSEMEYVQTMAEIATRASAVAQEATRRIGVYTTIVWTEEERNK